MTSKLANFSKLIKVVNPSFRRLYSNGLPENLRRNYEKFQKDDGVPVYLKGGISDRILFGVTLILIAIGLEESARVFIRLDVKK